MKKLHDRIMQAGLPPLNVDAALVQITGSYTSVSLLLFSSAVILKHLHSLYHACFLLMIS